MKRVGLCVSTVMVLVLLSGQRASATPQIPEKISYKGRMLVMISEPLEALFSKDNPKPSPLGTTWSSAWHRGYVATWKIENDFLWLISLEDGGGKPMPPSVFNKAWTLPVKAIWYTGKLLVDNHIIQVEKGRILGEHKADLEHPLAVLTEVESLSVTNITSAAIRRVVKNTTSISTETEDIGGYRIIPREELGDLLKIMATARKAVPVWREGKKNGYSVELLGGGIGSAGGIRFFIYDDGEGTYVQAGIGHGIQSEELAALAKRIYDSPVMLQRECPNS